MTVMECTATVYSLEITATQSIENISQSYKSLSLLIVELSLTVVLDSRRLFSNGFHYSNSSVEQSQIFVFG